MAVDIVLLGSVDLRIDGRAVPMLRPQQRSVLAALAVDAGRPVPVDTLVARVWSGAPPVAARRSAQALIARLNTAGGRALVVRRPAGYLLDVDPSAVDLHRFTMWVRAAEGGARVGDGERAGFLRQALGLWHGPPLAGVPGTWAARMRDSWAQRRLAAVVAWALVECRVGDPAEVTGPVADLLLDHPHAEPLAGALIQALHASGRTAEAIGRYTDFRRRLVEELGVDPGPALQALYRSLLSPAAAPATVLARPTVPAALPPDVDDFVGRGPQVSRVRGFLTAPPGGARPVVVVTGPGGVGKTALAVHAGRRVSDAFPDGQLHAGLRGTHGRPADPIEVVGRFLRLLGVAADAVPADPDERLDVYRSLLTDRRILILLDDAADDAQVRPLLPGGPGCAVLVTGRHRLGGLAGAERLTLPPFAAHDAVELLRRLCGGGRVDADPGATAEIIRWCAGLPLAVRIAGARLAARPHWPLTALAARLSDPRRRLDELSAGDLTISAAFTPTYRALAPDARRALRRLALLDTPDFTARTAAAVLAVDPTRAEDLTEKLAEAHLLEPHAADGTGCARYRFPELARLFARAQPDDIGRLAPTV